MSTTLNPCFECGACCQHFRVSFYHGEVASDFYPEGVPPEMVTRLDANKVCMKGTEKGASPCAALTHAPSTGYRCSIYAQRSSTCREFNTHLSSGQVNPDCQRLRSERGLKELDPIL